MRRKGGSRGGELRSDAGAGEFIDAGNGGPRRRNRGDMPDDDPVVPKNPTGQARSQQKPPQASSPERFQNS